MLLRRSKLLAPFLAAASGCVPYVTAYHAPLDGRARAVWDANGQMVVEPAGLVLTAECGAAIRALSGHDEMPLAGGTVDLPAPVAVAATASASGPWQPVYYGDAVAGPVPPGADGAPVYFWTPGLYWQDNAYAGYYGAIGHGAFGHPLMNRTVSGSAGAGGGGGGGGRDTAVVVAVLVAITLPIVDLAVASVTPISRSRAATVTDLVGAWNDLARTPGSPCAMPGGAVAMPPEVTAAPATTGVP